MHETAKLQEAHHFCSQLIKAQDDLSSADVFKYNLSAFLSAARSVVQYAHEEATLKSGGQRWYDEAVRLNKVIAFFKDKRDINIHQKPVHVKQDIALKFSETLHLSASLNIVVRDAEGNIKETRTVSDEAPSPASFQPPIIENRYRFNDWPGSEDVVNLCRLYLTELESLVTEGCRQGWLT